MDAGDGILIEIFPSNSTDIRTQQQETDVFLGNVALEAIHFHITEIPSKIPPIHKSCCLWISFP